MLAAPRRGDMSEAVAVRVGRRDTARGTLPERANWRERRRSWVSFRESAWELELLRGHWDGAWVLGEDSDPLGQMCDKRQKRQGAFISLLSFPVSFVCFVFGFAGSPLLLTGVL